MKTSGRPGWKHILYSLSLSLVIANIFIVAKSHSDTPNQPDKNHTTNALLSAIIEQVTISDKIEGSFEQRKYIHILPQPLLSKGVFQLDKKTGLVWQINTPVSSRIVFDSAGIHQHQKGQAVWEISNDRPGVAMIGELMRAALSYDWPLLENYFFINGSINGSSNSSISDVSETQGGKQQWALTLTPKETTLQKTIKHISLTGEQTLTSLTLFEVNNDRTEITFDML